ncbi:hypothetical protein Cgig2_016995 [Carnegiea gigantea]|uniref:Uncharacterized protein n=1 Tax=Carnegiea gigantea TaxID=171969 RepID=A0A9Q1KHV9_9CARY|nr:hypothetical protein Cgig2_016995 [Carnegiea gigantea]
MSGERERTPEESDQLTRSTKKMKRVGLGYPPKEDDNEGREDINMELDHQESWKPENMSLQLQELLQTKTMTISDNTRSNDSIRWEELYQQMQQSMTTFQEQQGRVNDQLRELITGLSRQALAGINAYQTMRLAGKAGKHTLQILVDSGSTHNFLDVEVARRLHCQLKRIPQMLVTVVDGNKLTCDTV